MFGLRIHFLLVPELETIDLQPFRGPRGGYLHSIFFFELVTVQPRGPRGRLARHQEWLSPRGGLRVRSHTTRASRPTANAVSPLSNERMELYVENILERVC